MSVWPWGRRTGATVRVLLDVSGTSIGGACVLFREGSVPLFCYGKRVPITIQDGEAPETAMERALTLVAQALTREGLPAIKRESGVSTYADEAILGIDAPWQQTVVHMEEKRSSTPFTFTRHTLAEILRKTEKVVTESGRQKVEQQVVGVRLNGYATKSPMGQSAKRAALIILLSQMHETVTNAVTAMVQEVLHVRRPTIVSGVSLRYRVLREAFPHERDLLILDAVGHAVALSLVRARTLVAIREFPSGKSMEERVAAVTAALKELATAYPLPRTILLVAEEGEAREHAKALQGAGLNELWVTEEPPAIIPVSRLPATEVAFAPGALADIRLALMTEYATLAPLGA